MFKIFSAIRKAIKKPVYCIFIDTGEVIEIPKGAYKETFEIEDGLYTINPELIHNDTLFYHSQYAEPLTLNPPKNNEVKYDIDSKRFKNIYDNKVLEQMMYVQEKGLLQYILLGVLIVAGLLAIDIYLDYTMFTNMQSIIDQLDKVETVNIGGK